VSDPKAPIQGIGQGNICGLTGWIIFEYSHDGNVKSLGLLFWSRIIRQDICRTSTKTFIPGSVAFNQRSAAAN
jgi:hypothetical protein